ncbi:unnamed protein product [Rotaria socialis]|uniref:RNA polymerase I-specific transcription initiation factor RRN3 n=1 Tax=Rotaria socialis TaxID=392032 RepID=A0A820JMT3_9BILA|nr:unnamed protein product [Rotaria socialis]CAF3392663.1 unnamed protein product [Rotaria socialis]CAF4330154.1 unnamed protein product [Rotaria socialis]CAF4531708.1 unnamed protein product [Rotaria socialis]
MLHTITIDHVKEALDQFNRGQKYLYNTITATIKENQTNEHWLIQLLNELRDNVDLFENMNDQFLDFLQLQINWAKQTKVVLDTFGTFQITLISSNTKHAQRYLGFLFTLFAIPENSTNPPLIHDFAHETLQQLVLIVPLSLTLLCPTAEQHFPFMTKDANIQVVYIRNLLRSLSYLSIQRSRYLEIIVSKLIRIDVHASRKDILHAEKVNIEDELVFSLEQLHTNDNNEMKHDQADKLDCLMYVLFEYITNVAVQNGIVNYLEAKSLFRDLLNVFNKILLPTHDSSHVQYLLFHICSFHTDFSDEFMNNCWRTFTSPSVSMTFRQSAVCYLCSLIARAKYISTRSVLTITQLMVDWLHSYVSTTETNSSNPNRHLPFYAICQAILYIFIYRHHEIARLPDGIETVSQWRLSRIIASELNPLKYCLAAITLRFAQLARNYQIVFCYSIIETNNRYSLPELFATNSYSNDNSAMIPSDILYSYFPFDPYVLKRSSIFIRPIYNDYREENDDIATTNESAGDTNGHDLDDGDDMLTSMMMSTTPGSFDPIEQMSSLSASFKNTRNPPSILPFGRSPGFRNI